MSEKVLLWVGSSLRDMREFPEDARQRAGYQLYRLQLGDDPDDWKPMATVGRGVREIRIHTGDAYRIFYVASFSEGVYVLHAFQKTTQRTRQQGIDLGRARFAEVVAARGRR